MIPPDQFTTVSQLPVFDVIPALVETLDRTGIAVLCAPPGAGKTTLVPIALLDAAWRTPSTGRVLLVEPRRLAARAAARRMAFLLNEEVGETVGYRMRFDTRVSAQTVIEVVTEGVFTRMIVDDPELTGVSSVIFDEFHERALDADFGLALALDSRMALREDLRILVMSATLDVERIATFLGQAPVIESQGQAYPVDIRHFERKPDEPVDKAMVRALRNVHDKETGSILAFMPGQAEIRRTAEALQGIFPGTTQVLPLYGGLSARDQDLAIQPAPPGQRKIVLATAIAETAITIDGVRIVIDGGLERLPVFEPSTGITRLETVRVSKASADQRAGRAGRTQPGIAIRLWRAEQTAGLKPFRPAEILACDLSGLILDCARIGIRDLNSLAFVDPPPAIAVAEARALLTRLGALDEAGGLSEVGRKMQQLGLPARLAAMVAKAGTMVGLAAELAIVLSENTLGGSSVDLEDRLRRMRSDGSARAQQARRAARRLVGKSSARSALELVDGHEKQPVDAHAIARILLAGFSDRAALQRGRRGHFVMANGRGAFIDEDDRLADAQALIIVDLTGKAQSQRILAAMALGRAELEALLDAQIEVTQACRFDVKSRSVRARRLRRFGALIFSDSPLKIAGHPGIADALSEGLATVGIAALPWGKRAAQLRARFGFLRARLGEPWPDMSEHALIEARQEWFTPFQNGVTAFGQISEQSLVDGLSCLVPYELHRELERLAPTHYRTPGGRLIPVDYGAKEPMISVRVQELFGLSQHPALADGGLPLTVELLSPAHRPIQITRDLPGFWAGSWKDVRLEMRGRYPKHAWPEDPQKAQPAGRARARGAPS